MLLCRIKWEGYRFGTTLEYDWLVYLHHESVTSFGHLMLQMLTIQTDYPKASILDSWLVKRTNVLMGADGIHFYYLDQVMGVPNGRLNAF